MYSFSDLQEMELQVGKVVGNKYTVEDKIGSGNYGVVFQGIDNYTEGGGNMSKVAIKFERNHVGMLAKENEIYKKLNGIVGIPKVMCYGSELGCEFLVMELLGPSLLDIQRNNDYNPLPLRTTLLIADQLMSLIQQIHSNNILHLDIKLDNIVMGIGPNSNVVHLIDFGMARAADDIRNGWMHQPKWDLTDAAKVFIDLTEGESSSSNDVVVPQEFSTYLAYCDNLQAGDTPNYDYCKNIFMDRFASYGFTDKVIFN